MNPSSWPSYLKRTMKDAVFATEECFQKVLNTTVNKLLNKLLVNKLLTLSSNLFLSY